MMLCPSCGREALPLPKSAVYTCKTATCPVMRFQLDVLTWADEREVGVGY